MPTPKTCEGYGLKPDTEEWNDCLNYRGKNSEKYKGGGKIANPNF